MWVSRTRYEQLIADAKPELILELRRQISELKEAVRLGGERVDREQQRADNALDSVALVKGLERVSPPVKPSVPEDDPYAEDSAIVEDIQQSMRDGGLGAVFPKVS